MRKILLVLTALVGLSACKVDNRIDSSTYTDSDFAVVCLHGFNYLVRVTGKSFMAPKFDRETGLPERCEK